MEIGVSDRSLSTAKARKSGGGSLDFDRTVLLPVALEARSELVGVHDSRLYDGAEHRTTQASWCSWALAMDAQRDRALPSCLQAKQPADVDDREGITRPIASLTRSP